MFNGFGDMGRGHFPPPPPPQGPGTPKKATGHPSWMELCFVSAGQNGTVCGSTKYPYPSRERHWKFQGVVVQRPKFPRGMGVRRVVYFQRVHLHLCFKYDTFLIYYTV